MVQDSPGAGSGGRRATLMVFFFAGYVSGTGLCILLWDHILPWMRGVAFSSVSIVLLPAVSVLPFLLSWIMWCFHPVFFYTVCFFRTFLFGFVHMGLMAAFDGCGWLVRWLVLFSDCLCLPLLCFFWLCLLRFVRRRFRMGVCFPVVAAFLALADRIFILPRATELLFLQKG